jgi:hypothetical protein
MHDFIVASGFIQKMYFIIKFAKFVIQKSTIVTNIICFYAVPGISLHLKVSYGLVSPQSKVPADTFLRIVLFYMKSPVYSQKLLL